MPRREPWQIGAYYHVYNRGVDHQIVFWEKSNYLHFLRLIRKHFFDEEDERVSGMLGSVQDTRRRAVEVAAYCLMPNHYHLLVRLRADDFSLRMASLTRSYVEAFNRRVGRTGYLFESRFQAKLIEDEAYLWHLSRYIHLNPAVAGLVAHPGDWPYSSYQEYVGWRSGSLPNPEIILRDFHDREQYRGFVEAPGFNRPNWIATRSTSKKVSGTKTSRTRSSLAIRASWYVARRRGAHRHGNPADSCGQRRAPRRR